MNGSSKITVTVLLIILCIGIGVFLTVLGVNSKAFLGLLAIGVFFGLKNMWKKPKDELTNTEIKLKKDDSENSLSKL